MSKYRHQLQLNSGQAFITDAGLETELIFRKDYDLLEFAAFPLLNNDKGRNDIKQYYKHYKVLKSRLSNMHVIGGCCGTNHLHVAEMAHACFS